VLAGVAYTSTMSSDRIHGTVDPAFAGVAEAFEEGFAVRGEVGASLAVVVGRRTVVDLVGGTADDAGVPWRPHTIVNAYSVVKPLAAACLLLLVERGRVGLDDPVTRWWPELGAAGKERITVRHVLAHEAGLTLFDRPPSLPTVLDWDAMIRLLEASPPEWRPGTAHGEHVVTYGHLVGEVVRRVDGRSLGTFLREELASPWGLDFHVGLAAPLRERAADVVDPDGTFVAPLGRPREIAEPAVVNGPAWRAAEIPAVNGHGTALALARFYAGLGAGGTLDGIRLLSPELVAELVRPQLVGPDRVLGREVAWGLGVQVDLEEGGFGMGGLGGNLGWWGEEGYAIGYVTRRLGGHDRAQAVDTAVREVLSRP
jgi:CubicO group peptidase (beta-lactamase class C family)